VSGTGNRGWIDELGAYAEGPGAPEMPEREMGEYVFLAYEEFDLGCPIDVDIFGGTKICIAYREITEMNLGTLPIPFWPFLAGLALIIIGKVFKGE
jgi:hypothetical protein